MTDTALLIIDMQEALVAGAYEARAVVDRIAALARRVRAAGRPVIYVQHNASSGPIVKGQPGWKIHHQLEPRAGDVVIEKAASDAFYDTALERTLREFRRENRADQRNDDRVLCRYHLSIRAESWIRCTSTERWSHDR